MRASFMLLALALIGCGSTGGPGGGATDLPVSGAGPFRPLDPADARWSSINAPFIVEDSDADLDSPFVLARGDKLSVWVSATRMKTTDIERADTDELEHLFSDLAPVLSADQSWENGSVASPSLIAGDPIVPHAAWILFYAAGGAIGYATSPDGSQWTKASGPALRGNGGEEGDQLSSPAAVRIGDRVRVYYEGANRIWAAETAYADVVAMRSVTWTRVDGDPATPLRDPIIHIPPWAQGITSISARVTETPAGRVRHDLYFTATAPSYMMMTAMSGCGFASSYTGDHFATGAAPIIPLTSSTHSPAATPYRAGSLLVYVTQAGARQAIAAATSP